MDGNSFSEEKRECRRRKQNVKINILWFEIMNFYFLWLSEEKNEILFLPESTEGVAAGQTTAMDYENEENRTEKWEKRDEYWAD